ncbi:MAG: N-methyl-L-tryptophan oxidase [Bacteroidota bacterium]|nr:N-methyl-L-tryptophan oxidase [Bacteroidota bacterium]
MDVIQQPATHFDVIVIGVGSMGASACYFLAKRGYSVLGLEQFDIPHEQGSHAGQSRIIRKAYFEDPNYVPLLNRAYENWEALEKETGTKLYFQTGLVYFGKPGNTLIKGVKQSASLYNVPLEKWDAGTPAGKFPQFKIPPGFETLFEPGAGFITPEKSVLLYAGQAIKNGAEIHVKEKVLNWKKEGSKIAVTTEKNTYRSNKLIITAGAWAGKIIPPIADQIKVTRQLVAWIKPRQWNNYSLHNFPCWMIADEEKPGAYYGFPALPVETFGEPAGLKLAYHYPGEITDPDKVNRQADPKEIRDLEYILAKYLPGAFESVLAIKTCLYANTRDENFVIDRLPGYEEQVTIACGFSGHGFKFASVAGEILADLAIKGKTEMPIGFLQVQRFV